MLIGCIVLRNIYPSDLRALRDQRWVRAIFFFALALKYHGNCRKYLCRTNSSALRYSLLLCRSQRHKERWRFVTLVRPKFTPLCPGPQTSTTATRAELGEKPALSSDTLFLRSPTCENLGATAHFKQHSPQPPHLPYTHAQFCTHPYLQATFLRLTDFYQATSFPFHTFVNL